MSNDIFVRNRDITATTLHHPLLDRLYPCNVIASCETGINDGAFGTLSLSEAYYTRLTRLQVLYFMLIRELREDMM